MNAARLTKAYQEGLAKGKSMISGPQATTTGGYTYFYDAARCLGALIDMTKQEVIDRVLAYHQERLDAIPDLNTYPELKGYRDLLDAHEKGMHDAGIPRDAIALQKTLNFWRDVKLLQETGKVYHARVLPEKCRVVYVPDSDRGALHAKNVDDPITYFTPRAPHTPDSPWPWQGPLCYDGVGSGLHLDEIPPEIFPCDGRTLAQELATTLEEARELLTRYNYFWGSQNLLVHDLHGNSLAFEKTRCRVAVREPNAQGINFITGMGAGTPEIADYIRAQRRKYMDQMGWDDTSMDACFWRSCEAKWENLTHYISELSLAPTFDNLKSVMEQRDRQGPMCLTGTPCHPDDKAPGCTLVMDLYALDEKTLHRRQWRGQKPAYLDTPEIHQFT